LSKGGDLKLKFGLPKARNCALNFTLYKHNNDYELINSAYFNVVNGKDGEITLKNVNMNLHRLEYIVTVEVLKEDHVEKTKIFLKFSTPFPGMI
jgi:hypothetical protein